MDFYITQNSVRRGPLRVFQVKEMLDRGELAPSDLGWHSGLTGWLPLSEIDAIAPYLPGATPPAEEESTEPDPTEKIDEAPATAATPWGSHHDQKGTAQPSP